MKFSFFNTAAARHLVSLFLGALSAIFRTSLTPVIDTLTIKRASNNVITNTGKVLDATAPYQHGVVFLKVMSFTWDIAGDLDPVCQTHTGNFTKR
jgi:hypothetical protein